MRFLLLKLKEISVDIKEIFNLVVAYQSVSSDKTACHGNVLIQIFVNVLIQISIDTNFCSCIFTNLC